VTVDEDKIERKRKEENTNPEAFLSFANPAQFET
jgi:hypothetical protein